MPHAPPRHRPQPLLALILAVGALLAGCDPEQTANERGLLDHNGRMIDQQARLTAQNAELTVRNARLQEYIAAKERTVSALSSAFAVACCALAASLFVNLTDRNSLRHDPTQTPRQRILADGNVRHRQQLPQPRPNGTQPEHPWRKRNRKGRRDRDHPSQPWQPPPRSA